MQFVHPDANWDVWSEATGLPRPKRLKNVNLLLGDNGSGKSTILQSIALAIFGPAAAEMVKLKNFVRFQGGNIGEVRARLVLSEQDSLEAEHVDSAIAIKQRGEHQAIRFAPDGLDENSAVLSELWADVMYEDRSTAFFMVGYGATRRVEPGESLDMGARSQSSLSRARRVEGLFKDSYSLVPMSYWLPKLKSKNPGRYKQVVELLDKLLKPSRFKFSEDRDQSGEYLFTRGKMQIPFQSLSDGYKAFIGWVADLLYHVCYGGPKGMKLVENSGVVLVDEIDLHLHPKWQMRVAEIVAKALPRMQFFFTSHSPPGCRKS